MKKPNILLIHADQHRLDCIGTYGNEDIHTPNIDEIANDGVKYTNSFTTFPVCTPSRYSLLTGLYVHQHLGWNNHCTLNTTIEKVPQILSRNGYKTKAVGKMHFTPTYLDVGFEEMELSEQDGNGRYDDDYHRYLMNNDLIDERDLIDQVYNYRKNASDEYWDSFGAIESNLKDKDYSTTWITDRAINEIENWTEHSKNFLMVGFIKPHHPFDAPKPWSEMYDEEKLKILPGWTEENLKIDINYNGGYFPFETLSEKKLKKVMAKYYASISQIDYSIGKIIELLKEKNIYDETMIIYTSDHGEYLGFHHLLLKGNYMYDPLMKVPLIIKYPHQKHKGEVNNLLFSNIDVTTTILKQASLSNGKYMEGINLENNSEGRKYIFAESGHGENYMIRGVDFKLLLCKDDKMSQFFDLNKDPLEINNLYNKAEYADEILKYKNQLFKWLLFEAPTPVYLNENEKIIDKDNALSVNSGHRKKFIDYYRQKLLSEY